MVLLKTLNIAALTPHILSFFAEQGVVTVEDFLVHDVEDLLAAARERFMCIELKQAVANLLSYLESVQENWSNGIEFFSEVRQFLPFNCESIDMLLHGGLLEGTVTELVGASSTGKSQAAASMAYRCPSSVIYVDTGNTFSADRVVQMLGSMFLSQYDILVSTREQHTNLMVAMANIRRMALFDIFSMLSFLQSLLGCLQSKSQIVNEFSQLRLLIIDSASAILAPILGGNNNRGHALMISMGQILKKLAAVNKIAVMITNHTVTGNKMHIKPALGESWLSIPHVRLWLTRHQDNNVCEISVIKHTSVACNKQAFFRIGTVGLVSVDNELLSHDSVDDVITFNAPSTSADKVRHVHEHPNLM